MPNVQFSGRSIPTSGKPGLRLSAVLFAMALMAWAVASCATSAEVLTCDDAGAGKTLCGALCVDMTSDPENCGACGKACANTETCTNSKCGTQCPAGEILCGGDAGHPTCVNSKTDNKNCGACGKACKPTEACIGGGCSSSCSTGKTMCMPEGGAPYCTDTKSDNANCGKCGAPCNATEACVGGVCQSSCSPDQTFCAPDGGSIASCVNLQTDNANCGDCGKKCGTLESCIDGACTSTCSPLQKKCIPDGGTPYCADTPSDNQNCGTCGTVCPANKPVCAGGSCSDGSCGNDCWGPAGCLTQGGHCIQFTCRAGNAGPSFCNACKGWSEVSYADWMNGGWCGDVIKTYRSTNASQTKCGASNLSCCNGSNNCGGGDNAWHFSDGVNNHYTGPCLGCANDVNCAYWNGTDNSTYTRLTVCKRF